MAPGASRSKMYFSVIASIVLMSKFYHTECASTSKSITATLDARWKHTPLLLEASEFLATESNESFWKFVDLVDKAHTFTTPSEHYQHILEVAGRILRPLGLNFLKLSLSLRYFSPRVELFNKEAHEIATGDCKSFLQLGSKLTCDLNEGVSLIKSSKELPLGWSFDFDHHYPNSESNPVTVVLYGQIGTPSFNTFHQELSLLAKSGKVHYILRHFIKDPSEGSIRLSGFGVELAVKSTEYKAVDDSKVKDESSESVQKVEEEAEDEVDGFLFGRLRKLYPDHKEQLDQFRAHLKESSNEMAPLKVWQLQDLSFQAAQRVLAAEPNRALKVLKDLSQNLPKQARSLVKTKVKEEMRKEILQNQKAFEIEPGQSALSINGLNLDIEDVNPFELLNILRAEAKTMDILSALGITGEGLSALVSMPVQSEHENYILDMRHECVTYVNDLEKDRQYWGWPQELQEILRPTFPGMLRYIAKNIFHAVFFIDPVDPKSIEIVKTAQELLHHSLPARIGVVIVAEDKDDAQSKAAVSIARAFSFIKADKSPLEAFDWLIKLYQSLSGTDAPKAGQVWDAFVASYSRDDADDVFGSDTEYDEDRKSANRLFAKTGRRSLPQVVVNGVPLKEEELDSIEEAIVTELLMQTGGIQRAVYSGALSGYPSVYEYIMRQPNVVGRLNDLVQSMERPFVDLVGSAETSGVSLDDADKFAELEKPQMVSVLCNNLRYFTKKKDELSLKPVTNWVVMDFSRKDGRNLLRAALKHVASSSNTRVGIIHNPSDETPELLRMGRTVEAVLLSKDHVTPAMAEFLENLLDEKNDLSDIGKASETVKDILKKTEGLKSQSIEEQLQDENAFKGRVLSHQTFAKTVLNLQPGQPAVITNGRVLGPLTEDNVFIEEDFKLLEDFDMDLYARKVRDQVDEMTFPNLSSDDDTSEFRSNVMMKVSSVLISREKKPRKQIEFNDDKHSAIHITSEGAVNFDVVAVVDPLTQDAQKLAPILMVLQNVTGVNLKLFMNCREKLSEMPLKRFYRYVLEPQITFDADSGIMNPGPFAQFSDMPETPLLTMNMDTPLGWMVEAVWSPHDLDNIRLSEVEQGVSAKFDLEYIFVEGHCADSQTGQPPRGLQFTLGTRNKADMFDTIVMANLGYFQLKASPGAWKLRVREGRSAEIYEINSLVGGKYEEESGDFIVTVDSFTGKLIKVKVQRKPGMESADLLSDSNDDSGGGIWDSLSNIVGSDSNKKTEEDQTINVFSVASGHLYERFLRIMMLSVLKHTKSPIKFWFLKNFLSPTLKSLLPHMARQYGFEYELVQYHWPHWLHAQTEKQRVIWGYKILFLDVLFPLHVKRIIFVDADLIVRTDLKELHDMDLGGAPYAYTPFCDSRTEMEGFRFWKQGYWRSHLGGRPYHISALYVVDLKKFRRMAAGDRLRGQYQGLSQDPNSLSNLDQDLPNNMIHQVPIKSLPQEWLWCATWCDEASKVYAKTIDLCNNPMTKEPKLDSAVRIVKEWPDYDNEVRRFQEKIKAEPSVTKPPENLPLPIKEEL